MATIVMISGSPGSGKSLFSCVLAAELAAKNHRVMIFSLDQNVPILPVFLAGQSIEAGTSVRTLFQTEQVNVALVANAVHLLPQNPMIGILPFGKEMDRCAAEGSYFNTISHCHTKYLEAVETITEEIMKLKDGVQVV